MSGVAWAGIEKKVFQGENPADVKAAEKLAKFFDLILKDNLKLVEKERHALNVFLTRILFCFFAEDTDIFKKGLFTESLASHTKADGSDLDDYLQRLFDLLNKKSRTGLPDYLKEFPYVNGGLFAEEFPIPKFSKKSRESLIDLGSDLNWAEINPDIFGSMIQAVVHPDQRAGLGMHYTSVTNIMKVIEPLFLTELKEEFESAKGNKNKLKKLKERIGSIKVFDPACGSGNFLIIAYKELRLLEMDVLKALGEIPMSGITLSNFYGIEIDDFAHEVAKLSLWLAEHQMDVLFNKEFGDVKASLPLKETGRIICENATRVDWKKCCSIKQDDETYVLGNPPYLGARLQSEEQKCDMALALNGIEGVNNLDYISCWFYKAGKFIEGNRAKSAFVTTNSICQGAQVPDLWPHILNDQIEIGFAHLSFKWSNQAKNNAAVICSIICLQNSSNKPKYLYQDDKQVQVGSINAYLVDYKPLYIQNRKTPMSQVPEVTFGSMPNDDGQLLFTPSEYKDFILKYPESKKFFKKAIGAEEFVNSRERYCLWLTENELVEAYKIEEIKKRINAVKTFRLKSTRGATKKLAEWPYRFGEVRHQSGPAIIIPCHTSERRDYIPFGFLSDSAVILNSALALYGASPLIFGIISSRMHMVWVRATCGRIKTDYRYSASVCYNNFPFPKISKEHEKKIMNKVNTLLKAREQFLEKSLADLYDPNTMPAEIKSAHEELDSCIEESYRNQKFNSDEERLKFLFSLYDDRLKDLK